MLLTTVTGQFRSSFDPGAVVRYKLESRIPLRRKWTMGKGCSNPIALALLTEGFL